jgi:Creatinase/Prolidase N-terminal domain
MSSVRLVDVALPDFGVPDRQPALATKVYSDRIRRFVACAADAGIDVLIVYADREHFANMAYLTGFEPRFEEALLVLPPDRTPVVITGPENQGYTPVSPIELELVLYPPFGLLGQDRRKTPPLADILANAGVRRGTVVGVAGWKYYGPSETATPDAWLETPSFIVDTLRSLVGDAGRVVNAARILMHPTKGLRAANEVDQLAQFEFAACHVSEAVKRVILGVKPGMREFDAARLMQPIGLPQSCHPVLMSGERTRLGLGSPTDKTISAGEPVTVALGLWGALTCRAGWLVRDESELPVDVRDYVERLAAPYFACAAEWYETVGIGVKGGDIDAMVRRNLGDPFFGLVLNPGHLIHLDEWLNTPVYPASDERLRSGQAIQLDIIPATGSAYCTVNIEDGIALLDDTGRATFRDRHPEAWARVEARRAFMADTLGIHLKPEVLPLSNLSGYLSPYMLAPGRALVKS